MIRALVLMCVVWLVPLACGMEPCSSDELAVYRVYLDTHWSRELFPKQYPEWRPPAGWSKLVGRTHDTSYWLFREGEPASPGLQVFAEKGQSDGLEAADQAGVYDEFTAPPVPRGVGRTLADFFLDGNHSLVSVAARVVPSPDWFVGVDSLDLCRNGHWIDSIAIEVDPMDAGTDNGFTFTAPNWPSEPKDPVSRITSRRPSHPANSFFYPKLDKLPSIATLTFVKCQREDNTNSDCCSTRHDGERSFVTSSVLDGTSTTRVTSMKQPETSSKHSLTSTRPSTTSIGHETTSIGPPTTSKRPLTTSKGPLATSTQLPTTVIRPPLTSKATPAISKRSLTTSPRPQLTSTQQANVLNTTILPSTSKMPPTTPEKPQVTSKKPTVTSKKPTVTSKKPPVTSKKPTVTSKKPTVTSKKPTVTSKKPTVTSKKPPVTSKKPTVSSKKPTVTSKKPPVTSEKPQVTSKKPPVTSKKPSVTSKKPPVTSKKPPTTLKRSSSALTEPEERTSTTRALTSSNPQTTTSNPTVRHTATSSISAALVPSNRSAEHLCPAPENIPPHTPTFSQTEIDDIDVLLEERVYHLSAELSRNASSLDANEISNEVGPVPDNAPDSNVFDSTESAVSRTSKSRRSRKGSREAKHCLVSEWSLWSACSVSCGVGDATRTRRVLAHPRRGGRPCPALHERRWCGGHSECPQNFFNW